MHGADCLLGLLELEPECLPTHQHVAAGRRLKLPPFNHPSLQRSGSMSTCQPFQSCTKELSSLAGKNKIKLSIKWCWSCRRGGGGGVTECTLCSVGLSLCRWTEIYSIIYTMHRLSIHVCFRASGIQTNVRGTTVPWFIELRLTRAAPINCHEGEIVELDLNVQHCLSPGC